MSMKAAMADLACCRDFRACEVMARIKNLAQMEQELAESREAEKVSELSTKQQRPFLNHPKVTEFLETFDERFYGVRGRWKPLAFLGASDCGKTWKAMSLFPGQTLKVSCNGLAKGIIPSLKSFDRAIHRAICFDEIRADQILGNRELFQSGQYACKLSQSSCAQHEYSVWLYGIAMLFCTNNLSLDVKSDSLESDTAWLERNVIRAELRPLQKWYH